MEGESSQPGRPRVVGPAVVAAVAELRAAGLRDKEIAARLGLPHPQVRAIRRLLKLPTVPKAWAAPDRCRHCHRRKVGRPRGLCFACYYAPGVRDLYPSAFVPEGEPDEDGIVPAAAACPGLPGSEEKIAAMAARFAAGEHLHHPEDARW